MSCSTHATLRSITCRVRRPMSRNDRRRSSMKAAVVTDFTKSLTVGEFDKPVPKAGEVLVRIETSGLCHTDIHAAHGDWPIKPTLPLVPGHEGVGVVERVGDGVEHVSVGDRVALPWLGSACGYCDYCVDGWETLCEKQVNTGYGRDGGYAEYAVADADYVAHGARRRRPARRRPADLRRRHHLQGGQGVRRRPGPARRGVRHRRPGSPRHAVRQDRRRDRRRGRRGGRETASWPRNSAPTTRSTR